MAASTFVPAPRSTRLPAGLTSAAAALTAPRGAGLAPVVPLPDRRADFEVMPGGPGSAQVPPLRLVPTPARARTRRRAVLLAILSGVLLFAIASAGLSLAAPGELESAGHVVLQPGETLWDVAVRSAPAGVDPRRQLDDIRRLNGFGSGTTDAWTVVLIPAR